MLVPRLQSAKQYARSYGLNFEKSLGCDESEFVNPESVQNPAGLAAVPQGQAETSVAHFTSLRSGQHYVGRVMVSVQSYPLPMRTVSWNVLYLASVLAREDLADTGMAVWDKIIPAGMERA
jgi:hypothetical protein